MASQESTAIHDLIQRMQGKVERPSENLEPFEIPSINRPRAAGTPAPYVLPQTIAQGTPARAYRVPTHTIEHDDEQTEHWHGTPRPALYTPTPRMPTPLPISGDSVQQALPVAQPYIPTRPDLSKLPRELSPVVRYTGLGVLAIAAISIGAYLGVSSGGEASAAKLDDRDRAIAIMSGEIPAPRETTHVVAPKTPTVRIEAIPTAEPIVEEPSPPVVIEPEEIEMDPVKRTTVRRAKRVVVARSEPKPKKVAKTKDVVATEIEAPKGALATKGTARLTISSNRPAIIFIDGRSTGKSAPAALVIPSGDHQITLLDPDTKKAKTATVKLETNKAVAINRDF